MSEQRFTLFGLENEVIKDNVTNECYWVIEYVQREKVVEIMNEQQATIDKLCTIIDWADSQFENDDTDLKFKWNAFVEKQGLNLEQIVNRGCHDE